MKDNCASAGPSVSRLIGVWCLCLVCILSYGSISERLELLLSGMNVLEGAWHKGIYMAITISTSQFHIKTCKSQLMYNNL